MKPQFAPNLTGFENLSGFYRSTFFAQVYIDYFRSRYFAAIGAPVILRLLSFLLFCGCFRSKFILRLAVFVPNLFCDECCYPVSVSLKE
ncbi:MAG: hypothetical protein DRR16_01370 [Candidatus Parabeggiatoa sp. nov. 3]|nr:MAG: hypothetical protein DRR00_31100 [Gammaproteobacteria bacterium]RKZ89907.1 MAG: hypothetical protein DRR16_01370 [Gammaproteobacteria bacterium]